MKTTRDILSHDDIAATCGNADCPTSDAEMTDADRALLAQVDAEATKAAPVALTADEFKALPIMTKIVRLDAGGAAYLSAWNNAYAVGADGDTHGRPIGWKPGRFGRV